MSDRTRWLIATVATLTFVAAATWTLFFNGPGLLHELGHRQALRLLDERARPLIENRIAELAANPQLDTSCTHEVELTLRDGLRAFRIHATITRAEFDPVWQDWTPACDNARAGYYGVWMEADWLGAPVPTRINYVTHRDLRAPDRTLP